MHHLNGNKVTEYFIHDGKLNLKGQLLRTQGRLKNSAGNLFDKNTKCIIDLSRAVGIQLIIMVLIIKAFNMKGRQGHRLTHTHFYN